MSNHQPKKKNLGFRNIRAPVDQERRMKVMAAKSGAEIVEHLRVQLDTTAQLMISDTWNRSLLYGMIIDAYLKVRNDDKLLAEIGLKKLPGSKKKRQLLIFERLCQVMFEGHEEADSMGAAFSPEAVRDIYRSWGDRCAMDLYMGMWEHLAIPLR